jgi:hypothetical protein
MASRPIFHFYNPNIRIESLLAREAFLHLCIGRRRLGQTPAEQPIRWPCLVECALRRRPE